MKRNWPWTATVVYLVQIPILLGYGAGRIPIHPIVIMLPLVGLLNGKFEGKGREGLGLIVVQPGRSLLLVLLFAALHFGGQLIVLRLESVPLRLFPLTLETMGTLVGDCAIAVFIIALWEEVVSRGYIQTRLQETWGFWGVIVATFLFASLHLPSAFLNYGGALTWVFFRFAQTGLSGFLMGYVYWRAGSILPTVVLHGLRNFAGSIISHLSGVIVAQIVVRQISFQFLWLIGQVGLMLFICRLLFSKRAKT
jgi:membrane protease YdiL (CAAX protease family)